MGRRLVAWLLVFSTALSGCALRRDPTVAPSPDAGLSLQAQIDAYPSGTRVRLGLRGGERIDGVLMWVDAESVSLETAPGATPRVIPRSSIVAVTTATTAEHRVRTASSWALAVTAVAATVVFLGYIIALANCGARGGC